MTGQSGESPTAPVNKVVPISTVDGPGARTAIFLQGCNIACVYCHNPETQRLCRACGSCVAACPAGALKMNGGSVLWTEPACTGCDVCIQDCPHFSTPKIRWMTPSQVMDEVRRSLPFVRGITVSGGECTLYPAFLTALFTAARREGLTCLLDSNGTTDFPRLPALTAACDGVMLDVKAWSADVYRRLTGCGNDAVVKRNLAYLARRGLLEEIRVVCLEGHVDAEAVIDGVADTLGVSVADARLKLIAFRGAGVRGLPANTPSPSAEQMTFLTERARRRGYGEVVVV